MKLPVRPAFAPRTLVVLLSAALAVLTAVVAAWARPAPQADQPDLIAPVADATLSESGLTFAWRAAPGSTQHYLLVSERPFDTAGLTALPASSDIRVTATATPVVDWASLRRSLDRDTRLYWAAADVAPSGRVAFSPVRSVYALRRFSNRAEASPLVAVSPIGIEAAAPGGPRTIHLRAGYEIDPAKGEPALPERLRLSSTATTGPRNYLVFYGDADPAATRKQILGAGGLVVAYVPDHAFLVRLRGNGDLSLSTPGAWTGAYEPAYKLSPRLAATPDAPQSVTVLLFPDGDLNGVEAAARAAGAGVLERSSGVNKILRLSLTRAGVEALAGHPDVAWIEPSTQNHHFNDTAQGLVQTGVVGNRRVWDMGLKGEGQVVMETDTGVNTSHFQFYDSANPISTFGQYPTNRKIIAYVQGSSSSAIAFGDHGIYHGTHVAGSIAGNDDPNSTSLRDGMAKNAKLYISDIGGPSANNSELTPADLNDLFQPGYTGNAGGAARLASNSWGGDVSGDYTIDSFTADQFMWNHPDFLLFFANGNAGSAPGTVGAPASAKDVVSVGASGDNAGGAAQNQVASFTSRGPTQDGRIKPTITSPGDFVTSAYTGTNAYQTLSGTSMATPTAAGCATLMRQYLTEGWYPTGAKVPANALTPSGALLKAMVVNSGTNIFTGQGYNAPDNNVGWGRINADSVLYFAGDTRRLLLVDQTAGLGNAQYIDYQINVVDGSVPLKVSLVWTDVPGNPAVTNQLVNDLDLTVSNGATIYRGNQFANGVSVTGGANDHTNVEEGVRIANPATGVWTVHVAGTSVPEGPQAYGLVVTGGLGTTAGALALDRASYGSASTVQLRVTDTNAGGSVNVTVTSPAEPAGETVTLTGANGVLTGSLPLSPVAGTAGDGTLQVSNGDAITATYHDASPVATIVASAQIGIEPPTITNVHAAGSGNGAVTISWTTNVSADSKVDYGPTAALGQSSPLDPLAVLQHGVTLTGLTQGQTYDFDVESKDLNGNLTVDDQGGAHYRFTVGAPGQILLVYDGGTYERDDRYTAALAATGWTYDLWSGSLSATPHLGTTTQGMRSYRAIWWQNGVDNYPPFTDAARDSITAYLNGGGRMVAVGHDLSWANEDASSSPFYTAARASWMQNTLHTNFNQDPPTWNGVTGVAADPISGAYTGGAPYTPFRSGAAGDEIALVNGAGSGSYDWISGDPSGADNCGFRWESSGVLGSPGTAVWGGQTSRLATMYFEWAAMDATNDPSTIRNDVLNKTLVWLIGRAHPLTMVTAPNGGETFTGASANISWTESTFGATTVASRTVEYSLDGGQSWTTLTTSAGPSPYVWNLTTVPNSSQALVRVTITDSGAPSLSESDASNAVFTIARSGGDVQGPVVVAGSIHATPDPIDNQQPANATATITDANTGGSAVTQAEWSFGDIAAPAGGGHAMSGGFGGATATVNAALATASFSPGTHRLWIRGRDAAGNWGPAGSLSLVVNGTVPLAVDGVPRDYGLGAGVPNPVATRARISYALPAAGDVRLAVYDITGRKVRSLVSGAIGAGVHEVEWDRRDDVGGLVRAGVYYYRLDVAGRTFTRRLATLD